MAGFFGEPTKLLTKPDRPPVFFRSMLVLRSRPSSEKRLTLPSGGLSVPRMAGDGLSMATSILPKVDVDWEVVLLYESCDLSGGGMF